ncbi:hypothetical protein IQ62_08640 [Streptomyces scabiei]|uniref:hypothetical protein n=1 Tax=Streptomyces scabiei TaxID=1930 RepID=UPI0004E66766|nr:hypothetical protein [Streptomyces scabiei]KFG01311.1 hypothetical protein IQ62_08640 [Streptomyces scabiei]
MNIVPNLSASAAGTGTNGFVWIGHDLDGWIVVLIAAVVGAFIYEMIMALTRAVTLRIPFLFLRVSRLSVPKELRAELYARWESELWYILDPAGKGWFARLLFVRFVAGMIYAVPITLFGARAQSKLIPRGADAPGEDTSTSREESGAKVRRAVSPITTVLYILMAVTALLVGTAGLLVYLVITKSSTAISMPAVMALMVGALLVIMRLVSTLRGDRS